MIIRRRTDADLLDVVNLLQAVHDADGYPAWWPADPASWLSPPGYAAGWVAEESHRPNSIMGHVCAVRDVDEPQVAALAAVTPDRLAGVSRLFVGPTARGHGCGTALLTALLAWTREQDLQPMLEVVDDGTPAVALYERLGWRVVDQREATFLAPSGQLLPVRIYLAPDSETAPPGAYTKQVGHPPHYHQDRPDGR